MFMDGCWKTLEKEIYVENIKKKICARKFMTTELNIDDGWNINFYGF